MKYVIGDIHGEYTKLKSLMQFISKKDKSPSLVFIGDYVDKGENPKKCLDYLLELSGIYDCNFIMGNHEYKWIEYSENEPETGDYLLKYGGLNTIKSFSDRINIKSVQEILLTEYALLFNALIPFWQNENYFVCHSGIPSSMYSTQPHDFTLNDFLFNRYNFIQSQKLYLGKKVIFGHTGFYYPYVDRYKIGIDTSACYIKEQPLTSFCLDDASFINSNGEVSQIEEYQLDRSPSIVRRIPYNHLNI